MHPNAQVTCTSPGHTTDLTYLAARLFSGDDSSLRIDHSNGLGLLRDWLRYQAVPSGRKTKLPGKKRDDRWKDVGVKFSWFPTYVVPSSVIASQFASTRLLAGLIPKEGKRRRIVFFLHFWKNLPTEYSFNRETKRRVLGIIEVRKNKYQDMFIWLML